MWRLELYGVSIQVIPRWMHKVLFYVDKLKGYPRLATGEFILIGNQTNEDLLRAGGFFEGGASFDYAVPLGHPLYGANAFTFYSHPGKQYADIPPETPMTYDAVRHEVIALVVKHLECVVAQDILADIVKEDSVFLIQPGEEVYDKIEI